MPRVDELEIGVALHLFGDRPLQGGEVSLLRFSIARRVVASGTPFHDDAFDRGHLTPVSLIGFEHDLYLECDSRT